MTPRIGIDARLSAYRDGGISTYTRNLVKALDQLNPALSIIVLQHVKAKQAMGTGFIEKKLLTPPHHRFEKFTLSAELLPQRLDILHSTDFIPPLRGARRHIITVHDLTFLHYPEFLTAESRRYYNAQINRAVTQADHILAVSEATRQDLIDMLAVPKSKITVQPHGVDEAYRPMSQAEKDATMQRLKLPASYILHVGTLEPRKNIIGLLKAYEALLQTMPDAPPVLLVGRPGWLFDETQQYIEQLGIRERVILRHDIEDRDLPGVYNLAAVAVSPSFYEGFGMPTLEAMACGVIPIVSNRSSLPEIIGEVGHLINPDDPFTITSALHHALTDTTWRQQMQHAALRRAREFTWKRSARIAMEVYTST